MVLDKHGQIVWADLAGRSHVGLKSGTSHN